jgi:hypothetical protein
MYDTLIEPFVPLLVTGTQNSWHGRAVELFAHGVTAPLLGSAVASKIIR